MVFHVIIRSLTRNVDDLELYSETFSNIKPSVVCLSTAWMSIVNQLRFLHLNKYLASVFHPGFNKIDGAVFFVQESLKYEVVCIKANLGYKIIAATKKNNPCFIVVCMYISPSFKLYSILNGLEMLLSDISSFPGSPVFIVGDKNIILLKENILSSFYSVSH